MNIKKIQQEIMAYLARCHSAENLRPASHLKDELCLDSLDIAGLIVHLEDKFNIEFDGSQMPPIQTIDDIACYAQTLISV